MRKFNAFQNLIEANLSHGELVAVNVRTAPTAMVFRAPGAPPETQFNMIAGRYQSILSDDDGAWLVMRHDNGLIAIDVADISHIQIPSAITQAKPRLV